MSLFRKTLPAIAAAFLACLIVSTFFLLSGGSAAETSAGVESVIPPLPDASGTAASVADSPDVLKDAGQPDAADTPAGTDGTTGPEAQPSVPESGAEPRENGEEKNEAAAEQAFLSAGAAEEPLSADEADEEQEETDPVSKWDMIYETVGHDVVFTNYLHPTLGRYYKVALSPELQHHTYEMCLKYRVPYKIVIALMGIESSWNADIGVLKNSSGSYVGLGMLSVKYNAGVFRERGIDIYQPEGNIEAICRVFSDKLREFDGNVHYALMAYNMGSGGAKTAVARGTHTTSYSRAIVKLADGLLTDVEYAVITKK